MRLAVEFLSDLLAQNRVCVNSKQKVGQGLAASHVREDGKGVVRSVSEILHNV